EVSDFALVFLRLSGNRKGREGAAKNTKKPTTAPLPAVPEVCVRSALTVAGAPSEYAHPLRLRVCAPCRSPGSPLSWASLQTRRGRGTFPHPRRSSWVRLGFLCQNPPGRRWRLHPLISF